MDFSKEDLIKEAIESLEVLDEALKKYIKPKNGSECMPQITLKQKELK